jgi:hypothetical protein
LEMQGARGTAHDDLGYFIRGGSIGLDPGPTPRIKNPWSAPEAFGHVSAPIHTEIDDDALAVIRDDAFFERIGIHRHPYSAIITSSIFHAGAKAVFGFVIGNLT